MNGSDIDKDIRILEQKPKYNGIGKTHVISKYTSNKVIQDSNNKDVIIVSTKVGSVIKGSIGTFGSMMTLQLKKNQFYSSHGIKLHINYKKFVML